MKPHLASLAIVGLLAGACTGGEGDPSGSNTPADPADTASPSVPSGLAATGTFSTQIEVAWQASTDNVGVAGYSIYRCTGSGCQPTVKISTVSGTAYTDAGLAPSTTYGYAVSAWDLAGNESTRSAIYEATTSAPSSDTTPPTTPTNLNGAVISQTQIDLAWGASTDNVGVVSYAVYRCTGSNCTPATKIATVTGTTFNSTGLTASTIYGFAVSARDGAGNESPLSATEFETTQNPPTDTTPPTVPAGLLATPISASQINLSWQPSTDNVAVADYTVYRCTGAGCTPTVQIATVSSGTSFQNTGLTGSTTYVYAVSASDQAGNGSAPSAPVTAITPAAPDTAPPTIPTGLTATAQSSSRIDLSWQASTDNVGVTKYSVYRCAGSGCNPTAKVADITSGLSFSNTGLTANTTYVYAVSASDAAGNESAKSASQTATTLPTTSPQAFTFIGAGDIASNVTTAESTAKLLDTAVAADANTIVFTTGDNAYPSGTQSDFANYYNPTWGRHKARTRPSPGNHDYGVAGAADYLTYFCPTSTNCSFPGGTKQLYYSYNLGDWHIVSLNSESGTGASSAQLTWLRNDLAAHPNSCVLAYWHRPRFSSGNTHGSNSGLAPFWDALYAAKADVIVIGHEHHYERFAKQNPSGGEDPNGIRQFVVGTGGAGNYSFGSVLPTSQARFTSSTIKGVIKFTLRNGSYDWAFVPTAATSFSDSGTNTCNK